MAIFKCKMCGGDLNVEADSKVIECEYCGTAQTVPALDNEKKVNLFNRANRLRLNSEFDKAAGIYESIVAEFPEEAEAYWGLCLCNYGIEYVDDPVNAKKIPTCHRASFEKLSSDENFNLALEYADVVAQKVYRDEAREIDRIMDEFLAISKNETPYDVFICYKETDPLGKRTIDSVLAQDIYDSLTAKGKKVFFARITLEDKLGQMYEPYIFAALNSAKVMLVVGTKYEHFHAVWVKNEWSRFLKLMAKDKSKVLIPCYKDMDAYDMPDEFKALQAQDMGKIGFMQDLLRGIDKIVGIQPTLSNNDTYTSDRISPQKEKAEALLKRAFIFLKDSDWKSATEYAEKVLDLEPENGEAYFAKLMADFKVKEREDFKYFDHYFQLKKGSIDLNDNYKKVQTYGTQKLKKEIEEYENQIEKNIRTQIENQKGKKYNEAVKLMEERRFLAAIDILKEIEDYRDSKDKIVICQKIINEYKGFISAAKCISTGSSISSIYSAGIKSDGTVVVTNPPGVCFGAQLDVSNWKDIVQVSSGKAHVVALRKDGTVVADQKSSLISFKETKVGHWKDIIEVSAALYSTFGLKKDGTVVTTNTGFKCDSWNNIVSISAGHRHVVGLKSDGTVIGCGEYGENKKGQIDVSDWKDIVAISAGDDYTIGLKSDGTVVATGDNYYGQCDVSKWTDIVAISAGGTLSVGLKADGTIVLTKNGTISCETSNWEDIVAISAGYDYILALRSDGKVESTIFKNKFQNSKMFESPEWKLKKFDYIKGFRERIAESATTTTAVKIQEIKQKNEKFSQYSKLLATDFNITVGVKNDKTLCFTKLPEAVESIRDWKDITSVSICGCVFGLKSDGTVVFGGDTRNGLDGNWDGVLDWTDIIAISVGAFHIVGLKSDGTVVSCGHNRCGECNVSDWTDIIAISATIDRTVGLRSDGTVVATGDNKYGNCEVSDWKNIIAVSAGIGRTVGLRSNGTVVCTPQVYGKIMQEVSTWTDIVGISTEINYVLGVKSDGSVVITDCPDVSNRSIFIGLNEATYWTDIVSVATSKSHIIAVKSDGSVVSTRYKGEEYTDECKTIDWNLL